MSRIEKARAWSIVGWVLTLLVWCLVWAVFATAFGVHPIIGGVVNFVLVFAFSSSAWYDSYLGWMEDHIFKSLKEDKDA